MTFREFCFKQWTLHCEECEGYDGKYPDYNSKEYFRRMKWFLRWQFRKLKESKAK